MVNGRYVYTALFYAQKIITNTVLHFRLFYKIMFGRLKYFTTFTPMKSIKISDKAQQELKVFAAKAQYNMSVIASEAILQFIKASKSKPSPSKP